MLTLVRQKLISLLWDEYISSTPSFKNMQFSHPIVLDHLAIIDLGYGNSTRMELVNIFSNLEFTLRGSDYLADKNNDFVWMAATDCDKLSCREAPPQIVLADFRMDEFSSAARNIIQKYASYQEPFDSSRFAKLVTHGNIDATAQFLFEQLCTRPWPLPTLEEYNIILEENELTAWVLLFGRTVNHFGVSVPLSSASPNLAHFNAQTSLELNEHGGTIKGGESVGIAQTSTMGEPCSVELIDGVVTTRGSFIELVQRYPITANPKLWNDYYTGFLAANADKVIESLYS